jgi:immune inhibitor A
MKTRSWLPILALCCAPLSADAAPRNSSRARPEARQHKNDNRAHPLGKRQFTQRRKAIKERLQGKGSGRVHQIANGQYVELARNRTDRIFVILVEFGDLGAKKGKEGPLHNQIAEPNRALDNTTIWQPDYSRAHYEDMYFNRMSAFYQAASSGRYDFTGAVTEWVKVPYNEATYGNNACDTCVWSLISHAINIWTEQQLSDGKTPAEIKAYLDTFDVWDRYDYNGNGNFDEPDGYIDHMQIVHAGEGEETGGGAQGEDAIWSHRWYAFYTGIGTTGPSFNKLGGTQFGNTGVWVGDYTIQPENGGLGVFAHEFAHDLGLPDQYDTTNTAENSTGFWTVMSSGSYLGDGTTDLGSVPGDFTTWEKLYLGFLWGDSWLNYDVAYAGSRSTHRLGPAETNTKASQGLFVVLPDRVRQEVLTAPFAGANSWYSGKGDDIDHSMTRTISLPGGAGTTSLPLTMALWYDIELDWDYAYVSVSTDGSNWTNLSSSVTTTTSPNGQNFGNGITGTSNGWVTTSFNLAPWAGQSIQLRIRYWTDAAVQGKGILIDEIAVGSTFYDGAESGANGWTLSGFGTTTGVVLSQSFNAYVVEYRQYRSYDTGLRTGPYNFSYLDRQNWVDHFPYQDGVLISYWDDYHSDNNVSGHPGEGLILPIDAHPEPLIRGDGRPWRPRVQAYDSTFGFESTDPIAMSYVNFGLGIQYPVTSHPSLPGETVFDDLRDYWYAETPYAGVIAPKTGTTIEIINVNTQDNFAEVHVRPSH